MLRLCDVVCGVQVIGDKWPVELHQLRSLKQHADNKELLTKMQTVKHVRTKHVRRIRPYDVTGISPLPIRFVPHFPSLPSRSL